jgi:hypothetical protein
MAHPIRHGAMVNAGRDEVGRVGVAQIMQPGPRQVILASFAQFERALIAERVRAGMARARRQGKHLGRPTVLNGNLDEFIAAIESGALSRRAVAKRLGVTVSTVSRACREKGIRTCRRGRFRGCPSATSRVWRCC